MIPQNAAHLFTRQSDQFQIQIRRFAFGVATADEGETSAGGRLAEGWAGVRLALSIAEVCIANTIDDIVDIKLIQRYQRRRSIQYYT